MGDICWPVETFWCTCPRWLAEELIWGKSNNCWQNVKWKDWDTGDICSVRPCFILGFQMLLQSFPTTFQEELWRGMCFDWTKLDVYNLPQPVWRKVMCNGHWAQCRLEMSWTACQWKQHVHSLPITHSYKVTHDPELLCSKPSVLRIGHSYKYLTDLLLRTLCY